MNRIVPQAIIDRADKCQHNHSCLKDGRCGSHEMCDVSEADGRDILFLCDTESADCPYRVPFGSGYLCKCPVHYWLYTNRKK